MVDNLQVSGYALDGAEADAGWTFTGFRVTTGTEDKLYSQYYVLENRTYKGYDWGLKVGPYYFGYGADKPDWSIISPIRMVCSSTTGTPRRLTTTPACTQDRASCCRSTRTMRLSTAWTDRVGGTASKPTTRRSDWQKTDGIPTSTTTACSRRFRVYRPLQYSTIACCTMTRPTRLGAFSIQHRDAVKVSGAVPDWLHAGPGRTGEEVVR